MFCCVSSKLDLLHRHENVVCFFTLSSVHTNGHLQLSSDSIHCIWTARPLMPYCWKIHALSFAFLTLSEISQKWLCWFEAIIGNSEFVNHSYSLVPFIHLCQLNCWAVSHSPSSTTISFFFSFKCFTMSWLLIILTHNGLYFDPTLANSQIKPL